MSDSLNDKLREILKWYEITEGRPAMGDLRTTEDRLIYKINQAFADEGWKDSAFIAENRSFGNFLDMSKKLKNYPDGTVMTGQEFYDRFKELIDGDNDLFPDNSAKRPRLTDAHSIAMDLYTRIDAAAKRAAGLTDE